MIKEQGFEHGVLCISLDTEFFWGLHDTYTVDEYKDRITCAKHRVIKEILNIFSKYDIHATWAIVGAIMAKNKLEFEKFMPDSNNMPHYSNPVRSSYRLIDTFGISDEFDDLFFGEEIIPMILETEY